MRVLVMTNLYPNPYQPNRAPFNRHQMRILSQNHAVRVIAPIAWTDEFKARRRGSPKLPDGRIVVHDGLTVEHPRYWFPPRFLRGYYGHFYYQSVKGAFRRAVAEFKPNLIFAPWAYPDGWAAVHFGKKARLPVVIQVHGSDVLLLDQFPSRKRGTIAALQAADGVVAVSQDIATRLTGLGVSSERIHVIYDGVDYNVFHPGSKSEARDRLGISKADPVVLFIGNLVPVKAVGVLLEACGILYRKGIAFQLCIIGQGELRPILERQADQLKIAEQVRFLGSLPQLQLPDWYRAADLFVLPSHSEGVPNVLLEASACGTPYVATKVGGIPEIAHLGQSHLVQPSNASALAEAILHTLSTPGTAPLQRPRAREEAVEELTGFLNQVIHLFSRVAEPDIVQPK